LRKTGANGRKMVEGTVRLGREVDLKSTLAQDKTKSEASL
jgi:hypothetical protein